MPYPQYEESQLVDSATYTTATATTHLLGNGEICVYTPTAASVATLPPVAFGGPVTICNQAAFTVTVKSADGSTVAGVVGTTGYVIPVGGVGAAQTQATFASDGTSWNRV